MKTCTVCKNTLPYEKFYNSKQTKDGKSYRCKDCEYLAVKGYRKRYYEKTKELQRQRNRKTKYGVTPEQYKKLRLEQKDRCKICSVKMDFKPKPDMKTRAVIDHCHETDKVRGLLCARCNQALGLFSDSVTSLQSAIKYLQSDIH